MLNLLLHVLKPRIPLREDDGRPGPSPVLSHLHLQRSREVLAEANKSMV